MKHVVLRVIEYGLKKSRFKLHEMFQELRLDPEEENYVRDLVWDADETASQPNKIIVVVPIVGGHKADGFHMLLPDAIFSYIDHMEIVEARRAAKEAKRLAWIAIWISSIIGFGSLALGLIQLQITLYQH